MITYVHNTVLRIVLTKTGFRKQNEEFDDSFPLLFFFFSPCAIANNERCIEV